MASAVGYYGDTGDRIVEEDSPPGTSFLSEVCAQWEAAADPARAAGVRVVHLRTGLVLSGDGGLLKRLKPIVQLGVAGKLGSGRQFMPWISLPTRCARSGTCSTHEVAGPVEPDRPRARRAMPSSCRRSAGCCTVRPCCRPRASRCGRARRVRRRVLTGQRAVPAVLTKAGFEFEHNDLESALRWALNR